MKRYEKISTFILQSRDTRVFPAGQKPIYIKMVKRGFKYIISYALLGLSIFCFISLCYAQSNPENTTSIAPEPSSIALVSTGMIGTMLQFARKRFRDFKRIFDTMLGAIGIVIITPLIIFTGLLIKIVSPGPVFFRQERVGWGGEIFNMYKLRTMEVDAEKYTGPVWAKEDDPRLIKFGKLIRKLHLDELPQLFNVLKGDMSIVGPRPERPVFVEKLNKDISDYKRRIAVRPGITGLAQVWHKYDETIEDVRKKVKYDLLYIREMCLMVDLRIILRTMVVAALGKGAR